VLGLKLNAVHRITDAPASQVKAYTTLTLWNNYGKARGNKWVQERISPINA
jgi:hypothetical protein